MTTRVLQADVTVIGSGIIGQSIALEARSVGLRVAVLQKPRMGAGSPAAGGMLSPAGEAFDSEQSLINLANESCRIYPEFIQKVESLSGLKAGYRTDGTLMIALTRDHVGELEQLGEAQRARGLHTKWIQPQALKQIEPNLSPRQCGGLLASDDHQVNPALLNKALLKANQNSGTLFIPYSGKLELEQTSGIASGVLLEEHPLYDRIESPWVVSADGAWSHEIGALAHMPLRPVRGQYVRLKGPQLINHVIRTPDVYMIPRENGVLYLGASMEEAGFDHTPLAGHSMELLWHAFRAVPGIYELEILETAVGFRPALRDNLPAIGPTSIPGLLTAFGHYRHGMMLAPITAAAILEILQSNRVPELLSALSPTRFNDESST